jgi:hypothetical protein
MVISMLDQMLFRLACGHDVVLGRVANRKNWMCESCGKETDLSAEPFESKIEKDLDTATQIDLQQKARGEAVTRLA